MKVSFEETVDASEVKIVRHWRLIWTPWGSLLIGRVNTVRSVWIETKKNLWYVALARQEGEQ